jgi:hypothetical protein
VNKVVRQRYTAKEKFYAALSFACSALAGYGAINLSETVVGLPRSMDPVSPLVGLIVFIISLVLMMNGVDAVKTKRVSKEIKQVAEWQASQRPKRDA